MKISTKGRYALRFMLDLAMSDNGGEVCIPIKIIAQRQNISIKYLEQITNVLSKAGYVKSIRGSKGGYRLAMPPSKYTVGMILRTIEGSLAPVSCLDSDPSECPRCEECMTLPVWKKLNRAINDVVDNITLEDIISGSGDTDYMI